MGMMVDKFSVTVKFWHLAKSGSTARVRPIAESMVGEGVPDMVVDVLGITMLNGGQRGE